MPVDRREVANMYYYKVEGNDLSNDRIEDGDTVLIREECDMHPNDICLVSIMPYTALVLRKLIEHDGEFVFCTAGSLVNPIHNNFADVMIVGKVVEVSIRL